ncbi:IS110 family transposase [Pseudomonas palleroniana]|uniref:IS110 family transposase n=1 Tax=Pseudomonas palleroniana TaxID=191390 RepID=A0A1H5NUS5_9PSED|nr:transposase [Pseudomonas palleroniana]KAB0563206.1 IS110 family transposase [Pseudomonas palleroniana]PTC22573.1 IS110 family transposase [Pseudomonas palleroniana]PTC22859.1 IS110 family transposase [Pseudomonas palleroniana]PTC25090.1 IS110 family transposase [Pseudomonas palleroniana]PTC29721.1 IS110 family transposase [Pseudomonas palleroniana]
MFSYSAGIDVSKDSLEARIHLLEAGVSCSNTEKDLPALIGWLRLYQVSRVLVEATGGYERNVVKAAQAAGLQVICVNPRRAKAFSRAMGQKAKTDPIDAKSLAQFAAVIDSPSARITSPEHERLRALVQQREHFVQQRDDDRRRLKTASCDAVKPALQSHIEYLSAAVEAINQLIRQSANELDREKVARLCSVKGIGLITASSLMAYLPELGEIGGRPIAALAGLAPYNNDSGKHKGARHISGGRFAARRSLYMACWVIIRDQPEFQARYQLLRDKGKCAKVALIACMRVLLVRLNAMLRDGTEWKEHTA